MGKAARIRDNATSGVLSIVSAGALWFSILSLQLRYMNIIAIIMFAIALIFIYASFAGDNKLGVILGVIGLLAVLYQPILWGLISFGWLPPEYHHLFLIEDLFDFSKNFNIKPAKVGNIGDA